LTSSTGSQVLDARESSNCATGQAGSTWIAEVKILNEPPVDGDRSHLKKTAKAKFFQAKQENMSIGKA
jgi:hypothetical protein